MSFSTIKVTELFLYSIDYSVLYRERPANQPFRPAAGASCENPVFSARVCCWHGIGAVQLDRPAQIMLVSRTYGICINTRMAWDFQVQPAVGKLNREIACYTSKIHAIWVDWTHHTACCVVGASIGRATRLQPGLLSNFTVTSCWRSWQILPLESLQTLTWGQ